MNNRSTNEAVIYHVVLNTKKQYSLWPGHLKLPLGWDQVGKSGTKTECLAYIKETWIDMRPPSSRE